MASYQMEGEALVEDTKMLQMEGSLIVGNHMLRFSLLDLAQPMMIP